MYMSKEKHRDVNLHVPPPKPCIRFPLMVILHVSLFTLEIVSFLRDVESNIASDVFGRCVNRQLGQADQVMI